MMKIIRKQKQYCQLYFDFFEYNKKEAGEGNRELSQMIELMSHVEISKT